MHRRDLLGGALALGTVGALALPAAAEDRAVRLFRIRRDGRDIGRHRLTARTTDKGFEIAIDIDIAVKVLGITGYRYELENREVWSNRQLVSLSSRTNDDGTRERAKVVRAGDMLEIDGSGYDGTVTADAVTTSYYVTQFMERRPWISTQDGAPLSIDVERASANRWSVTGELETLLIYDERGEWMGSEFDAGGEPGTYELIDETGPIAPLWERA